jgi:ribosomal 50S subunit-recycling heat shock protein
MLIESASHQSCADDRDARLVRLVTSSLVKRRTSSQRNAVGGHAAREGRPRKPSADAVSANR